MAFVPPARLDITVPVDRALNTNNLCHMQIQTIRRVGRVTDNNLYFQARLLRTSVAVVFHKHFMHENLALV